MEKVTVLRQKRRITGESGASQARRLGINANLLSYVEQRKLVIPAKWRPVLAAFYGMAESDLFDADGFAILAEEASHD